MILDVNEFYRTAVFNVTRCPHCGTKFRVSSQRDKRRISQRLFEGRMAACPACRKNFVIRLIPDETETRRIDRKIAAGLDQFIRENRLTSADSSTNSLANGVDDVHRRDPPKNSPLPPGRSLVPVHNQGKLLVRANQPHIRGERTTTNVDCWSSYNPQPSCVSHPGVGAKFKQSQPQFSWSTWGCGTVLLGMIVYVPFALILILVCGPDLGCPLGLLAGMLLAGIICYRLELEAPARKASRARAKQQRDEKRRAERGEGWLSRTLRERAELRAQHPELSYESYLADRGLGNMSTVGRLVVAWLAAKHLGTLPCLADYQLWKAEKRGKMKKSTGWAIRLALIDWSRSHRQRREADEQMRRQAEYVAEAMKK